MPPRERVSRKELLALPVRAWDKTTEYDYLYLVPYGKKHDNGYSLIAVVGCNERKPVEIAAICDDICWGFPLEPHPYTEFSSRNYASMVLRTDCEWPSGIIRVWGSSETRFSSRFRVHSALSSTEVELFITRSGVTHDLLDVARRSQRREEALT